MKAIQSKAMDEFNQKIRGSKVAVVGIGVSNVPLIKFLINHGASVVAHDKRTESQLGVTYNELKALGVEFILGENYLDKIDDDVKVIYKTPGVRFDVPAL